MLVTMRVPPKFSYHVYHFEDEVDWSDIVRDLIKRNLGELDYVYIKSEDTNLRNILNAEDPGIVICDLRIGEPFTEFQTAIKLGDLVPSLLSRGFEVFVLSGFLHDNVKSRLLHAGIPEDHIFEKGRYFSRQNFILSLKKAGQRLLEKSLELGNLVTLPLIRF